MLAAVNHPRGVGWAVEDQRLGLGGDGLAELLGGEVKPVLLGGLHHHGGAPHHLNQFIVTHPVGRREDDLVPRVHQGLQGGVQNRLAAAGDHHLVGGVVQAPVLLQPLAHRLADGQGAGGGGVLGLVCLNGPDACLLDAFRGGEIGLPHAEADDVDALGPHLLKLRVDGHGGGCPDGLG